MVLELAQLSKLAESLRRRATRSPDPLGKSRVRNRWPRLRQWPKLLFLPACPIPSRTTGVKLETVPAWSWRLCPKPSCFEFFSLAPERRAASYHRLEALLPVWSLRLRVTMLSAGSCQNVNPRCFRSRLRKRYSYWPVSWVSGNLWGAFSCFHFRTSAVITSSRMYCMSLEFTNGAGTTPVPPCRRRQTETSTSRKNFP